MANLNRATVMGVLALPPKQSNFPTVAALRHSAWLHPSFGRTRPLANAKKRVSGTESPPATNIPIRQTSINKS